MQRALRALAYVAALVASTAISALAVARLLPLIPGGALGFVLTTLGVVTVALVVAALERSLPWGASMQAAREPKPAWLRGHSQLLAGHAPLPLATGVVLGSLLAVRLS